MLGFMWQKDTYAVAVFVARQAKGREFDPTRVEFVTLLT
jgi:hypothetical protein